VVVAAAPSRVTVVAAAVVVALDPHVPRGVAQQIHHHARPGSRTAQMSEDHQRNMEAFDQVHPMRFRAVQRGGGRRFEKLVEWDGGNGLMKSVENSL